MSRDLREGKMPKNRLSKHLYCFFGSRIFDFRAVCVCAKNWYLLWNGIKRKTEIHSSARRWWWHSITAVHFVSSQKKEKKCIDKKKIGWTEEKGDFDFLFLHFRFICFASLEMHSMMATVKWWPLAPLALYGLKPKKHTHIKINVYFVWSEKKYEKNIWSFIAVHHVRCPAISPANEFILINAQMHTIRIDGTLLHSVKLFLEMTHERELYTSLRICTHSQTDSTRVEEKKSNNKNNTHGIEFNAVFHHYHIVYHSLDSCFISFLL